jgi:hypothetical protein
MIKLGKVSVETRGFKFVDPNEDNGQLQNFG